MFPHLWANARFFPTAASPSPSAVANPPFLSRRSVPSSPLNSDGRRYKKEKGERKERTTDGRTDAVFLVGFCAAAAAAAAGGRGGGGRFADVAVAANERCPVAGRTVTARAGEGEGGLPTTHTVSVFHEMPTEKSGICWLR